MTEYLAIEKELITHSHKTHHLTESDVLVILIGGSNKEQTHTTEDKTGFTLVATGAGTTPSYLIYTNLTLPPRKGLLKRNHACSLLTSVHADCQVFIQLQAGFMFTTILKTLKHEEMDHGSYS